MHIKTPTTLALLVILINLFLRATTYAEFTPFTDYNLLSPVQRGHASWYSENDPGINLHTANNEIFDDDQLTAAMWEVPFNQLVRVTNLENGRSVVVRVNDRGPHRRFVSNGRIIDLTKRAFEEIAPLGQGLVPIELELL